MSVLIRGIEMPNNCIDCRFCDIDLSSPTTFYVHCTASDKTILKCDYEEDFEETYQTLKNGRQERCPLVEVPDSRWIPIESRPMNDEEREFYKEYYGDDPEDNEAVIYSNIPEHCQEVLTCSKWGHVSMDTFYNDNYGCYFEENGDMDGIVAWMPLPEPYKA